MAVPSKKYFFFSLVFHLTIILVLVLGLDFAMPMPVLENTHQNDVISAVVLGDIPKSNVLPQEPSQPIVKNTQPEKKVEPKPIPPQKIKITKDVISLKPVDKKKITDEKMLAKDLLADIKKLDEKKKKIKQKQLETQFKKNLREQAEKTLRKQLLDEEIKMQALEDRQAQGEVNKYKALMMQAISEHWIIPVQANKKIYAVLMIRLAPDGMVLDVQVTRSSGDPSLDSSARAAVLKSSPLPVPSSPTAFEPFREFVLKMKPENVISS